MINQGQCQHCAGLYEYEAGSKSEFCPHCGKETYCAALPDSEAVNASSEHKFMSQETRGSDSARAVKVIAAILMCVGMFMSFIWVGFAVLLILGFFLFVVGRFME